MNSQQIPHEVIHTIVQRSGLTFKGMVSAIIVGLVAVVPAILWAFGVPFPFPPGKSLPTPKVITAMSDLVTAKVHVSSDYASWNNHYKISWLLHGDVLLGVDMSQARYEMSDLEKRRVTISLPQPHLVASKVDHDQSRQLSVEHKVPFAGWLSNTDSLRNSVWSHAERRVRELGQTEESMQEARSNAEVVLIKFFDKLDWKLDIKWRSPSYAPLDSLLTAVPSKS